LCRIKQRQSQRGPHVEAHEMASDPQVHHHIGQSEKSYNDLGQYLCEHGGDPAMKVNNSYELMITILRYYTGFPSSIEGSYSQSPRSGYF
jgi:hypothetical protein